MAILDTKLTVVEAYQSARDADPHADAKRINEIAHEVGNKFSVPWQDVVKWSIEFDNDVLADDPEKPVAQTFPVITDEVRQDAAERYSKMLQTHPLAKARELAATIAMPLGVAPDAVQAWARQYETFRRPQDWQNRKDQGFFTGTSGQKVVDDTGESTMMASAMNSESTNLASEARSRALVGQPLDSRGDPRGPNRFSETVSRLSSGLPAKEAHHDNSDEETPAEESEAAQLAAADAEIDAEFGDDGIELEDHDSDSGPQLSEPARHVAGATVAPDRAAVGLGNRSGVRKPGSARPAGRSLPGQKLHKWRATKNRRRAGTRPDRSEAIREGGCVTMPATAKRIPISTPRISCESRTITLDEFAGIMEQLRTLQDYGGSDIDSPEATGLAAYIHNNGDNIDRAEALLAVLPIACRVMERKDNTGEARDAIRELKGGAQ